MMHDTVLAAFKLYWELMQSCHRCTIVTGLQLGGSSNSLATPPWLGILFSNIQILNVLQASQNVYIVMYLHLYIYIYIYTYI